MSTSSLNRSHDLTYSTTPGNEISSEDLQSCSTLYNENYGVWAPHSKALRKSSVPGGRVKLPPTGLKQELLSDPDRTILVTCHLDGLLIGHAFATSWDCGQDVVGWVTQLVVLEKHRRKKIATNLLRCLTENKWYSGITILGIASSHPVSCKALANLAGISLGDIDTNFIAQNATRVLGSSPVSYLKTSEPRGSLFQNESESDVVSSIATRFPINHAEPLAVLEKFVSEGCWRLGNLKENDEFLVIAPVAVDPRLLPT